MIALLTAIGQCDQAPQLPAAASLATLDDMVAAMGLEPLAGSDVRLLQAPWAPVTRRWSEEAARAIAFSINTSACLLDLDAVIVDGAVGAPVLAHLIDAVRAALAHYSWQGITRPDLIAASPSCLSIGIVQYIPVFPICRK